MFLYIFIYVYNLIINQFLKLYKDYFLDVTFEEKELLEKIFFVRNESNIVFNCEPKKLKRTLVLFESELISLTAASG
jgi:hypothetical protein